MADPITHKQFHLPVYNANGSGALIAPSDTLNVRKMSQTYNPNTGKTELVLQAQAITVAEVNDDATIIGWAVSSANGFTTAEEVYDLDPDHSWSCPKAANLSGVLTSTITSFTINGVQTTGLSFAVSAEGAAAAEAWLNNYFHNTLGLTQVYATVVFDSTPDPDELIIYVNNFDGTVKANSTDID